MSGFGAEWGTLKLDVHGRTFFAVAETRHHTQWFGLIRVWPRRVCAIREEFPRLPAGWTTRREWSRDVLLVMPRWVALAHDIWEHRWAPMRWALALDRKYGTQLIDIAEGDYYRNARPRGWRDLPRFN